MTIKTLSRVCLTAAIIFGLNGVLHAEAPTKDMQAKIILGTPAPANKYPSTVALLIKGAFEDIIGGNTTSPATEAYYQSQFCAGTVLSAEWVLTAAHCLIDFSEAEIMVLAGVQSLVIADTNNLPGERSDVSNIVRHPDYGIQTFDADLALLKLATPLSAAIPSSALFSGSLAETAISPTATSCTNADNCATIVGWGTTDPVDGADFPTDLLEAQVPIVGQVRCNNLFGGGITANMFCAGFDLGGADTCQGDSGGPVFMSASGNPQAQDFQVAGVTSFGAGCGNAESPGGYTRVPVFASYINGFVSGATAVANVPSIDAQTTVFNLSISSGAPVDVTTLTATDGDNDILAWSLNDTFDEDFAGHASFFAINSTGLLQLTSIPNPIANPYRFIAKVTDDQEGADYQLIEVNLVNDAVSATQSTVSSNVSSLDADGSDAAVITVTLNTASGTPITNAGNVVQIAASGSAQVSAVTNNGDGTYTANITNSTAQAVTVTVTAAGVQLSNSPSITFNATPTVPPVGDSGTSSGGGSTGWLLIGLLACGIRGRRQTVAVAR